MLYIRKLLEGKVNYDLTNPLKNAFIVCPQCGDVMLLDREAWSTKCFNCSYVEWDIPGMVVGRTNLTREAACVSYGIFLESGAYSLNSNISFAKIKTIASELRGSMAELKKNHLKLMKNEFLFEAFMIHSSMSKVEVEGSNAGISVDGDCGVFLVPEVEMLSLITSMEIISMHDPGIRIELQLVATSQN